jgi:hypothetical protein
MNYNEAYAVYSQTVYGWIVFAILSFVMLLRLAAIGNYRAIEDPTIKHNNRKIFYFHMVLTEFAFTGLAFAILLYEYPNTCV